MTRMCVGTEHSSAQVVCISSTVRNTYKADRSSTSNRPNLFDIVLYSNSLSDSAKDRLELSSRLTSVTQAMA